MEQPFETIKTIVTDIQGLRETFLTQNPQEVNLGINLKKLTYTDIYYDHNFQTLIRHSLKNLVMFDFSLLDDYQFDYQDITVRYRIKNPDTINEKIEQYYRREQTLGGINLQKGLNDFLGVRLIMVGINDNAEAIIEYLRSLGVRRPYYRHDHEYRGIHGYFYGNNSQFPWELQLWDEASRNDNLADHQYHEQQRITENGGEDNGTFNYLSHD